MLAGSELIIALFIVFLGAVVMGTVSFGLGLVVAPVLLFFLVPQQAVITVNGIIAILVLFIVVQTRQYLDLRLVGGMVLGGLAAVPIGVFFLGSANPTVLRLTIAAVILVLGGISLFNIQLPLARN